MGKVTYLKPSDKVCPVCGSTHIAEISRITGYLAFDERFGEAKTKERIARTPNNTEPNREQIEKELEELDGGEEEDYDKGI